MSKVTETEMRALRTQIVIAMLDSDKVLKNIIRTYVT